MLWSNSACERMPLGMGGTRIGENFPIGPRSKHVVHIAAGNMGRIIHLGQLPLLKRCENKSGLVWYESPLLSGVGVPHAFSTRLGGVSAEPFDTLNYQPADCDLSHIDPTAELREPSTGEVDGYAQVRENVERLAAAMGQAATPVRCIWQVHGTNVVDSVALLTPVPKRSPCIVAKADGILTDRTNELVAIRVADCVPILLADDSGKVVAAVHAGWRGLVGGIVPNAVSKLAERSRSNRSTLIAAIGPCISVDHFEVGPEVAEAFMKADLAEAIVDRQPRPHVDLPLAISIQLQRVGLLPDRIDRTDRCSFRDESEFFSHRRDHGRTGRMCAMIGIRSDAP